ncbi:MAG: glycosyltransferase family 9 protein [Patescibacteria group bacterium]|nr:glycosyltransferase family 9 protein [Patescibacteria group bacterium]
MDVRKALTFRASSIGDCLMGKYLLENIHAEVPEARLGIVIASRGDMIRDLFAAYPWLEVIEANRRSPRSLLALLRDFHGSDLVVTQYAGKRGGRFSLTSKFFARLLARKGGLVGFADASAWNGTLYDRLLPVRSDRAIAEHERAVLMAAGIPVSLPFPKLIRLPDDAVVRKFGLEAGKYVVMHFFAGGKGRSLSPEKSRELLAVLQSVLPTDISILVSGSAADRASAQSIAGGTGAKVIAGETTVQEMMNLISRSRGVVSVDTGMAHIAAELGKPLVVLRTCLGRQWWLPEQYGADASITIFSCDEVCAAGHRYNGYPDCLGAIPVEAVAKAVRTYMLPDPVRES